MNELIKIAGVGFVGGMLALTVKKDKPEAALLTALGTAVLILISVTEKIGGIINDLRIMIENCGVDIKYFVIAIKAVGIAYIAQFTAEILRDCGEGAIASKVEAAGKISILSLAMPVMTSFLELCVRVVNSI
jgi:stage III sporulation protein AD